MQSLDNDMDDLNNDMDELFRRAGEEYPLNTNGADWNKITQQLYDTESSGRDEKKNNNYKYLLLLLLLPIAFVCGRYVGNGKNDIVTKTNKEGHKDISRFNKTKPGISSEQTTELEQKKFNNKIKVRGEVANKKSLNHSDIDAGTSVKNFKANNTAANSSSVTKSANNDLINNNPINKKSIKDKKRKSFSAENSRLLKKSKNQNNLITAKKTSGTDATSPVIIKKIASTTNTPAIADTAKKVDSLFNKNSQSLVNKKTIGKNKKSFKGKFYYLIVIGPDISTVKLQKASNVGYSTGLMLGYQINKKLSVTAGALWDRKNYYTEGKYLDTSRLKLPVHIEIQNATGYCDMIEIPVNIAYNFLTKKDRSWFVSTGLSAYLMKYEYYNLAYKRYNMTGERDYGYKNSSRDWMSIINISAGYKKVLGRRSTVSIEPYIKLPLKGVGIGKLPVSSTGVYISLSRSFW